MAKRRTKADKEFEAKVSRIAAAATENNPVSMLRMHEITDAVLAAAAKGEDMKAAAKEAVRKINGVYNE